MSIIHDPTNYAENTTQALQSIQRLQKQVEHNILQAKQFVTQYKQWLSRPNLTVPKPTDAVFAELSQLTELRVNLQRMSTSLQTLQGVFTQRVKTAKSLGMDFNQYMAWEKDRIDRNVAAAVNTAQRERHILQAVRMEFEYASDLLEQVEKAGGMHEDAQVFNRQMARVLYQHADLAQILAPVGTGNGILTQDFMTKLERRQLQIERGKAVRSDVEKTGAVEAETLRSLRGAAR